MEVNATLVSKSRDGKRAEVTVLVVGEEGLRQSITRHLHLINNAWIGNNPNKKGVALLQVAEKALERAARDYLLARDVANAAAERLERIILGTENWLGSDNWLVRAGAEILKRDELRLADAAAELKYWKEHVEELRTLYPKEVRFIF